MRAHLQRLVSVVQRYIEAGAAFAAVGRAFASELMHVQSEAESWFTRLGPLAPALMRFGETFDEIQVSWRFGFGRSVDRVTYYTRPARSPPP